MCPALSRRIVLLAAACTWAAPSWTQAQEFPSRPVKVIVPYAPGGATDILARLLAVKLQEAWGQTVLVENKPGASGVLGNDMVAKAAPDGHTLLLGITAIIQSPALIAKLPYDPYKDFIPVTQVATSSSLLSVPAKLPVKTVAEFVALVKAQPGKHSFGSFGNGSSAHIQGSLLAAAAGLDLAHVPYKGAAPMTADLLGGQLSSAFVDVGSARAHVASGGFRVLAVTGTERLKLVPDAPTMAEAGFKGFEPRGWFGFFLPAGTPAPVVAKTAAALQKAIKTPDVLARIEDLGLQAVGGTPEQFAAVLKNDGPLYAKLIKDLNIKLE
jgi:tripartite-type tricarboxylate transporter receptor subunit TctC